MSNRNNVIGFETRRRMDDDRSMLAPTLRTEMFCYDVETTDSDVDHAQILQLAYVVADGNMVETRNGDMRARRLPYVVPSPTAMRITRLSPGELDDPANADEYDFSGDVEKLLGPINGTERVLLTFNGIRFDDEVIRRTLFRNLRNPFVASGRGNARVDVFQMLHLAMYGEPDMFPPLVDLEGKASRRLEHACRCLGMGFDGAHDALADTRATLRLAQFIRAGAPWAWDLSLARGATAPLNARMAEACEEGQLVWHYRRVDGRDELAPCAVLGQNGKKQWLLADVRRDPAGLPGSISHLSQASQGNGRFLRVAKASKSAMVLFGDEAERFAPVQSPAVMRERVRQLHGMRDAVSSYMAAFRAMDDEYAALDAEPGRTPEQRIYSNIDRVQAADKARLREFHRIERWSDRASVEFDDPSLADFAARLVLRHHGHELSARDAERLANRCEASLSRAHAGIDSKWFTLERGLADPECDDAWREWASEAFPSPAQAMAI